jgi:hypothetical protein
MTAMTLEQRIEEWVKDTFASLPSGYPDEAVRHLSVCATTLAAAVREEAIEELLRKYRDVVSEKLNLHYDQRAYSWHDLQFAMEEAEKTLRALKSRP